MALLSKWFKVATANETIDGRKIEESWLQDIAETYDRSEYTASIFREHIPWLGNFGVVHSVKTAPDKKGRLCLFARVEPNQRLLELNKNGQALFTSISIVPDFAGTGKHYLGHLAITDTPASLGTEQLAFSGQKLPDDFIASQPIETDFDLDEGSLNKKQKSFIQKLFSLGSDESSDNDSETHSNEEDSDMKRPQKEAMDKLFSQLGTLIGQYNDLNQQGTDNKPESEQPAADNTELFSRLEKMEADLKKLVGEQEPEQPQESDFSEKLGALENAISQLQTDFKNALGEQPGTDPGQHEGGGEEKIEIY